MAHRRRLKKCSVQEGITHAIYEEESDIGDFEALLIRSWDTGRRRKRGLQWVSAMPTSPFTLSHVLTLLRPHLMRRSDQDFQGILSGSPFPLHGILVGNIIEDV